MDSLITPFPHAAAITPSDANDLAVPARGVYVGVAGNVAIVTITNEVVTFVGALAGSIIPVRTKRVNATNTTATNLVALW